MSSMNLPLEIYDILERKVGRDDAMAVAKCIEVSLVQMGERSKEMAAQRKLEAKDELRIELRNELATKEDLAKLQGSVKEDLAKLQGSVKEDLAKIDARFERMDKKFTNLFLILMFTVIFLNQSALEFLARLIGLVK